MFVQFMCAAFLFVATCTFVRASTALFSSYAMFYYHQATFGRRSQWGWFRSRLKFIVVLFVFVVIFFFIIVFFRVVRFCVVWVVRCCFRFTISLFKILNCIEDILFTSWLLVPGQHRLVVHPGVTQDLHQGWYLIYWVVVGLLLLHPHPLYCSLHLWLQHC